MSYLVEPFIILKAPYLTGQPTRLGEVDYTPLGQHVQTAKYVAIVKYVGTIENP